jgi:hypothetical protein
MQTGGFLHLTLFDVAADEGVADYKLEEGGCEEEGCTDEQGLIELFVGSLVLLGKALHYPHGEVAGVDEEGETD